MEDRIHYRQKSKVPRARFSSRSGAEYVELSTTTYQNGVRGRLSPTAALDSTDESKEWRRLIGERVCIGGVKQGVLRYYGRTNFAQGHWCGVELDEPVGKNNGTVAGVVYFQCLPNHGIFAPVGKVSKLNTAAPIKNSSSDPTSLRPLAAGAPRKSESFSAMNGKYGFGRKKFCSLKEELQTNYFEQSGELRPKLALPQGYENPKTPTNGLLGDYKFPESALHGRNLYQEMSTNPVFGPEDEMDNDDPMSVDESLGILTPSQMDATLLAGDRLTSCSDIRAVDFPSSESFDDINDLPEDEQVHDVSVQYLQEAAARSVEVSKPSTNGFASMSSSTDQFLFSISSKGYAEPDPQSPQIEADAALMASADGPPATNLSDSNKLLKMMELNGSRDSLLVAAASKEKLTVSWEDREASSGTRPESVYTVASNDTGYQEEVEEVEVDFDPEDGTAAKRFSTLSRDSCIVSDDVDGYKIAESNSTSGYSTGLSDSCCNDRADDDTTTSCRQPFTDESIQDSMGPCDSEDAFSLQDNVTQDVSDVTTDMETVLCLDSTSDALCETIVEDATLTEIHDLLMSPEDTPAPPVEQAQDAQDMQEPAGASGGFAPEPTVEKSDPIPSESSPSKKSTPEKRPSTTKRPDTSKPTPTKTRKPDDPPKKQQQQQQQQQLAPKSPKKNVMSKIKAMIEATSCKTTSRSSEDKRSAPKKSRWETVTSKIAASLAEEKTKPKARKEIKSRVDTNLAVARQQVSIVCKSPRLDGARLMQRGDGSMSPMSVASRDRRIHSERSSAPGSLREGKESQSRELRQDTKSPRHLNRLLSLMAGCAPVCRMTYVIPTPPGPGKTSRSTSPVAASESSTNSVSLASHNSRSKIAHWKGSNSTVASSTAPLNNKKQTSKPTVKQPLVTTRGPTARLVAKRTTPVSCPSAKNTSPASKADAPKIYVGRQSKTTKEQNVPRGAHVAAQKPVRPAMWLSKAELTQEIQHLGNLCEARTKELNRLKMETKHVTVGFDAFAALLKYMVEDLNALTAPKLAADLERTLKHLELAKQDLAYYEREIEELKAHHCQELNDLSNKLFEVYQGEVAELTAKHQEELRHMGSDHQTQVEKLSMTYSASSEELKTNHEKLISTLELELVNQREEFHLIQEREIKDLEEKHVQSSKVLQEHIEQLQKKCAELKQHSLSIEDAMHKDTDSKLQWVTARKLDLEKEVESLKAVLEMKNKELHSLRVQNLEMDKQLEELPFAKEKIKMLHARAEDLEALMVEKTKLERRLSTENQVIKETYDKESKINKRLSMENEELQWRLRQAEQSLISSSFSEAVAGTEEIEEEEPAMASPSKSPAPYTVSKSVFFTFVDKDEGTPQSPRSQYRKITPAFAANYKTSPGRLAKSPTAPSPRKAKSNSEPPQPTGLNGTPRKLAKQPLSRTKGKRPRSGSDNTRLQINENGDTAFLSVADSMASSVSSESSVFENKEKLLENNQEQIIASLEILREQRSTEDALIVLTPTSEPPQASNMDAENMSRSAEFSDPKTYYHMTFPLLKADCDIDENGRSGSSSQNSPTKVPESHSMPKARSLSLQMDESASGICIGMSTSLPVNYTMVRDTENNIEPYEHLEKAQSNEDVDGAGEQN